MTLTVAFLAIGALLSFSLAIRWGVDWRIAQQTISPTDAQRAIVPMLMLKHLAMSAVALVLMILILHGGTL